MEYNGKLRLRDMEEKVESLEKCVLVVSKPTYTTNNTTKSKDTHTAQLMNQS
jgi:hypothetical protein